jgi:hypothetical protein
MITGVASSPTQKFAGARSLAVTINGAGSQTVRVANPGTPAGRTVTFHIWIPSGTQLASIQPYVLQNATGGWTWTGNWRAISSLTTNAWNTVTVTVPSTAPPLAELGVEIATTSGASVNTIVYVDSVSW